MNDKSLTDECIQINKIQLNKLITELTEFCMHLQEEYFSCIIHICELAKKSQEMINEIRCFCSEIYQKEHIETEHIE